MFNVFVTLAVLNIFVSGNDFLIQLQVHLAKGPVVRMVVYVILLMDSQHVFVLCYSLDNIVSKVFIQIKRKMFNVSFHFINKCFLYRLIAKLCQIQSTLIIGLYFFSDKTFEPFTISTKLGMIYPLWFENICIDFGNVELKVKVKISIS